MLGQIVGCRKEYRGSVPSPPFSYKETVPKAKFINENIILGIVEYLYPFLKQNRKQRNPQRAGEETVGKGLGTGRRWLAPVLTRSESKDTQVQAQWAQLHGS